MKTSTLLQRATSIEEAVEVVIAALRDYLAKAMESDAETINPDLPLSSLGGEFDLSPIFGQLLFLPGYED